MTSVSYGCGQAQSDLISSTEAGANSKLCLGGRPVLLGQLTDKKINLLARFFVRALP